MTSDIFKIRFTSEQRKVLDDALPTTKNDTIAALINAALTEYLAARKIDYPAPNAKGWPKRTFEKTEFFYDEESGLTNYQKKVLAQIQALGQNAILSEAGGSNKRNWGAKEKLSGKVLFNVREETVSRLVELGHLIYYVSEREKDTFFYAVLPSNNEIADKFLRLGSK